MLLLKYSPQLDDAAATTKVLLLCIQEEAESIPVLQAILFVILEGTRVNIEDESG